MEILIIEEGDPKGRIIQHHMADIILSKENGQWRVLKSRVGEVNLSKPKNRCLYMDDQRRHPIT